MAKQVDSKANETDKALLEQRLRMLTERYEDSLDEIHKLNRKIQNVENTLSFRLGYALIHSTKSINAALSLPQTLGQLRKEAVNRRGGGQRVRLPQRVSNVLGASVSILQDKLKAK
jgi:hypothetical protein